MSEKTNIAVVQVRVNIPADLLRRFELAAVLAGREVEDQIAAHLDRTIDQTDEAGIWMTGPDAKEMRRILGGRVDTSSKVLEMIRRLTRWNVNGLKLELSPARQEVINAYAKSMQQPVEQILPILIDQALGARLKC